MQYVDKGHACEGRTGEIWRTISLQKQKYLISMKNV